MPVAMRLSRWGRIHRPFYRIVVADQKMPRDGRHLEKLGTYDPLPASNGTKVVSLNFNRVQYWLSVGALPSDAVARLLGQAGLLPAAPRAVHQPKVATDTAGDKIAAQPPPQAKKKAPARGAK